MKPFLLGAQLACLLSLAISGTWRRYRIVTALLAFSLVATAAFQTDSTWLQSWYAWSVLPVAVLRFLGALEVSHRQTHEFRYWSRLTGAAFLLATFYALSVWICSPNDLLGTWVQARRYPQIWCAAYYLVLELFWLCFGCWRGNYRDWAAVAFTVLMLNHGAVSLAGQVTRWPGLTWWRTAGYSWGVEAVGWLGFGVAVWRGRK